MPSTEPETIYRHAILGDAQISELKAELSALGWICTNLPVEGVDLIHFSIDDIERYSSPDGKLSFILEFGIQSILYASGANVPAISELVEPLGILLVPY